MALTLHRVSCHVNLLVKRLLGTPETWTISYWQQIPLNAFIGRAVANSTAGEKYEVAQDGSSAA